MELRLVARCPQHCSVLPTSPNSKKEGQIVSEQDKLQIIGSVTLEYSNSRKRAAFIRVELEQVIKAFDALLDDLRT